MTIGDAFVWVAVIYVAPDLLLIIRSVYVFFVHKRIRNHIQKIVSYEVKENKIGLDEIDSVKYIHNLYNVYWDFDKMMKHWWVFDINKMRN